MPRMWGLNADKQVHGWTSFVNRHLQPCRLVLVPTILLVQIAARAGWDYSTGGVGLRPSCHTLLDRGYWHVLGQSPVKYLFFLEWHQSGSPADDFSLVCSLALVPWCKDEASKWHAAIRIGGLVGWAEHFRKRIHTWIAYLEKNARSGRAADTGMWFPNEWFYSPSHSPCFKHSNFSTTLHSIFMYLHWIVEKCWTWHAVNLGFRHHKFKHLYIVSPECSAHDFSWRWHVTFDASKRSCVRLFLKDDEWRSQQNIGNFQ